MTARATQEEWDNATLKDIMEDPKKFGAPTKEEFFRDPEKWSTIMTLAKRLAQIEKGPTITRKGLRKQFLVINGIVCSTLEQAEHVAREENIDLGIISGAQLKDIGNGRHDHYWFFNEKKEANGNLILPFG